MSDNGEVLQGLDGHWTFAGATLIEWACGLVMFFIISLFGSPIQAMPMMIAGMVITAMSLASLRKVYPDEERGVRNAFMAACGLPPRDIPLPAGLQPIWSPCPIRALRADCKFMILGLDGIFPSHQDGLGEEIK